MLGVRHSQEHFGRNLGAAALRSVGVWFAETKRPPTEGAYRLKAARTNAAISSERAATISGRKNFSIHANSEMAFWFL